MIGEALVEGRFYAYGEKRGIGQPLLKVKLVQKDRAQGEAQDSVQWTGHIRDLTSRCQAPARPRGLMRVGPLGRSRRLR